MGGVFNRILRFKRSIALRSAALLLVLLSLSSCIGTPSAYEAMTELRAAYGISRPIFSPEAEEGDEGYCPEGFLDTVFGDIGGYVSDFALLFISDLSFVGECDILVCHSGYDALAVTEAALMRLELLRGDSAGQNTTALADAFVERRGSTVVLCALPDNARARRLLSRVL